MSNFCFNEMMILSTTSLVVRTKIKFTELDCSPNGKRRLLIIFGCFLFHNLRINIYCEIVWNPLVAIFNCRCIDHD